MKKNKKPIKKKKKVVKKVLKKKKIVRKVTDEEIKHIKENAEHYVNNYKKYKK